MSHPPRDTVKLVVWSGQISELACWLNLPESQLDKLMKGRAVREINITLNNSHHVRSAVSREVQKRGGYE